MNLRFGLRIGGMLGFSLKLKGHSPQLIGNYGEIRPFRRFRRPTSLHQTSPIRVAPVRHRWPERVAHDSAYHQFQIFKLQLIWNLFEMDPVSLFLYHLLNICEL